jgi:hypothetical protein
VARWRRTPTGETRPGVARTSGVCGGEGLLPSKFRPICCGALEKDPGFIVQLCGEGPSPTGRRRTALTQPHGPPPRQVASLALRRPERRTEEQRAYLTQLRSADPAIAAATDLVDGCLAVLRRREGDRLPSWLDAAEASGMGDLARFARTLREDRVAVQAGPKLRWSNGQTDGQVGRPKLTKRQGYGRARVDLLRQRLLRAARPKPVPKTARPTLPSDHRACGRPRV